MRGVREHVDHAGCGAGVASFVDEQAGITGQGGGACSGIVYSGSGSHKVVIGSAGYEF